MDRFGAVTSWKTGREGLDHVGGDLAHPRREKVILAIKESLQNGGGPVLLTGEPGSGKTWVADSVCSDLGESFRTVAVDLSPAVGPLEFYRLLQHRLGLEAASDIASARVSVEDGLSDDSANGLRAILVVEEAHNATDAVFEELRILLNRRERPDGFWGMLLIGQSSLARRLQSRPLAAFASRIAGRVHLRTFDVVEFAESIRTRNEPEKAATPIDADGRADAPTLAEHPRNQAWEPPTITGPRPPLDEADGMIEVGWEEALAEPEAKDADAEIDLAPYEDPETAVEEADDEVDLDEPIHDHYTALQAWNEWSKRQGRQGEDRLDSKADDSAIEPEEAAQAAVNDDEAVETDEPAGTFWADGHQEFAPYSQLFSRMKKSRESQ